MEDGASTVEHKDVEPKPGPWQKLVDLVTGVNVLTSLIVVLIGVCTWFVSLGGDVLRNRVDITNLQGDVDELEMRQNAVNASITATQKQLTDEVNGKLGRIENRANQLENKLTETSNDVKWLREFLVNKGR